MERRRQPATPLERPGTNKLPSNWEVSLWRGIASIALPLPEVCHPPLAQPSSTPAPIPPGDIGPILLEQLEFTIETRHSHGNLCVCRLCDKYRHISRLLLETFQ